MIKDFNTFEDGTERRLKPAVDVQIGALVPVGCRNHLIYAESPDANKCVNRLDGECPYLRQKKARFKKGDNVPDTFCPAGGLTVDNLKARNLKTRPIQLGYFSIPEHIRIEMGLPDRPTEIPSVIFVSQKIFSADDRIVQFEPIERFFDYPVFDYNLSLWSSTACICKGDNETAHRYPFTPTHPEHQKPRVCDMKTCPDFYTNGGQCRPSGQLYFRVTNAPGFPSMWRISTRSATAIRYIINEIRNLHASLRGCLSFVPLVLSLEKETATAEIKKNGETATVKSEVYRLHIRTDFTWEQARVALQKRHEFLSAGDTIQQIAASTPDAKMLPAAPIEAQATAEPADIDEADVVHEEPPAAETQQKKAEPDPVAEAEAYEQECIEALAKCKTVADIKETVLKFSFKKRFPGFVPTRANEFYAECLRTVSAPKVEQPTEPAKRTLEHEVAIEKVRGFIGQGCCDLLNVQDWLGLAQAPTSVAVLTEDQCRTIIQKVEAAL